MRPRRITALWRASAAASYLLASRQDQCHGVGAFAITAAAHEAIIATLPQDKSLWPLQCQGGQRPSRVEAAIVNRLAATRGPGEAYNGHCHIWQEKPLSPRLADSLTDLIT